MTFLELAKNRYSERYFDPRKVEQEKIDKILEAGRTAPTACNYQPQRIYVIQSDEALAKARSMRITHYNAPLMFLVCYDKDAVWKSTRDRMYDSYTTGEQDAAIVATTMMYEAQELGVHSVWLRGFDSLQIIETFGLPENHIPVMMFSMGYPNDQTKPNDWHFQRKELEETVKYL